MGCPISLHSTRTPSSNSTLLGTRLFRLRQLYGRRCMQRVFWVVRWFEWELCTVWGFCHRHSRAEMGLIPWKKSTSLLSNVKTMLATFSSCSPPPPSLASCLFVHFYGNALVVGTDSLYACVRMCWCMFCARVFIAFRPRRVAKAEIAENCEMC